MASNLLAAALGASNRKDEEYSRMGSMFSEWANFVEKEALTKKVKKLGEALVEEYVKTGGELTPESLMKIQKDNKATTEQMQYVTEKMGSVIRSSRESRPELFPRTRLDDAGNTISEFVSRKDLETPVITAQPTAKEQILKSILGNMGGMPQPAAPQQPLPSVPEVTLQKPGILSNLMSQGGQPSMPSAPPSGLPQQPPSMPTHQLPPGPDPGPQAGGQAPPISGGGWLSNLPPMQRAIVEKEFGIKDPERKVFYGEGGPVSVQKGNVPPEGFFGSQAAFQTSRREDAKVLSDKTTIGRKNLIDSYNIGISSLFGKDSKISIYMNALQEGNTPGKYDKLRKILNDPKADPWKKQLAQALIDKLAKITGVSPKAPASPTPISPQQGASDWRNYINIGK